MQTTLILLIQSAAITVSIKNSHSGIKGRLQGNSKLSTAIVKTNNYILTSWDASECNSGAKPSVKQRENTGATYYALLSSAHGVLLF